MHILLPETDNCPSWISGWERMTVENISWSISTKNVADLGGGWTRDLQVSSRTAHLTEPPRPYHLRKVKTITLECFLLQFWILHLGFRVDLFLARIPCSLIALLLNSNVYINASEVTDLYHIRKLFFQLAKLMFSMLSKNFSRQHFEIFFLFVPENRLGHFMQMVS